MRWPLLAALILLGCAPDDKPGINLAPAATHNAETGIHIVDAKTKAQSIVKNGAKVGDTTAVGLVKDLDAAQKSQAQTQKDLDTAQKAAAKLEAEHEADMQAEARRNRAIVIALFVGALIFYIGEKAKNDSPYTMLIPEVIAGMLAVMIACALTAAVISLWTAFGWVIHLL